MTVQQQADLAQQALRAFERDLPRLWAERPGQWVAYRGDRLLGFAAHKHELYHRCFAQGLTREEFVIFCIEPLETEIFIGPDITDAGEGGAMTVPQQADLGQQALRVFERDLPRLWAERPGQWVAYQGDRLLGFAAQQHELYQNCFEQGLTHEEFVVFCIEPLETELFIGPDIWD